MKFHRRAAGWPSQVAVFPGSFNPPTVAHLALAEAALGQASEVVFVLPEVFPHKDFSGVGFAERLDLLLAAAEHPRFTVATSQGGLFLDIARELKPHYSDAALHFLCGRDAAERIVSWDYGSPDALTEMFAEFGLLVAARDGDYVPPSVHAAAMQRLPLARDYSEVSATEVRQRIRAQGDWEHLIPPAIRAKVGQLYV